MQRRGAFIRPGLALAVCVSLVLAAACASTTVPAPTLQAAVPPAHPDFQYPAVPSSLHGARAAASFERGWQLLQRNDAPAAEREFAAALRSDSGFYPASTGQGYAALAQGEHDRALRDFDEALTHASDYMPALAGRGQALLGLERVDEALAAFEAASRSDPSVDALRNRVDVLRFRTLQTKIAYARTAAEAGRTAEARAAYEAALAASPESGFLYRELAIVERRARDEDAALRHLRRAVELDPADAAALLELGALLEARGELAGALEVYTQAATLQPSAELGEKTRTLSQRIRDQQLPAEFRAIAALAQATRGDLAALIGVRLDRLLASATQQRVVVTDARSHWASSWIGQVLDAGVMTELENHTFQPAVGLRRVDLAEVAARLLRLVPAASATLLAARVVIADVPPTHLNYSSISTVVAAGVMPLLEGQRFLVTTGVTGAEAIDVIDRIRALAEAAR